ncbi:hypothetical protein SAMD00019534_011850 [Acytostelium subglobosum LB1]|uniref:hypothetical protein n=1 Tax=Acytostelium subglobosum LB1 TaxID=1410327 RepID=UPI000644B731|nr:hypothetical protein SAMD00019534_011850 [Acytostelium subglobosum LB1]GAM18010.1 hypothetical protein SAMD00019534_011850 [Acytostelium subglobosum LB1]|eukprot:XP_012758606.1 hypothetical protein SAMD00019534_011850 [Acytostelium subglobosum LB1]
MAPQQQQQQLQQHQQQQQIPQQLSPTVQSLQTQQTSPQQFSQQDGHHFQQQQQIHHQPMHPQPMHPSSQYGYPRSGAPKVYGGGRGGGGGGGVMGGGSPIGAPQPFYGGAMRGSRGGYRGGIRGRGGRGGYRGGATGGVNYYNPQSGGYPHAYGGGGHSRMLNTIVNIPAFSGGAVIGVKGSLWGLINKATTARIKIFRTYVTINCPDSAQLDRAKEIVLKLKNTAAKYLSLIDYKGDQKLKFVDQPNHAVVVLDNRQMPASDENVDIQEVARTHDPQFASRFNETFSTLSIDKATQMPLVDIKTGKIWFIKCSDIPTAPMSSDKYELYTESLDSVFQTSSCINEAYVHQHTLFKEKKPYVLITLLDTESLDILTIKCLEEKVTVSSTTSPTATPPPNSNGNTSQPGTPSSASAAAATTSTTASGYTEYQFVNPSIYKQSHHISAKILFPQCRQSHFDLKTTIDSISKLPLDNSHDNLRKFISSIKIHKNNANGNNAYTIPESNLFIAESLIVQKVSIYRNEQKTLQFHLFEDTVTRLTTTTPEFNRPASSILCTSPSLYDMFKSKNWSIEQVLEEIKSLAKNVRIMISQQDMNKLQTSPAPADLEQSIPTGSGVDGDELDQQGDDDHQEGDDDVDDVDQ